MADSIREELFKLMDSGNRDFQIKLIPGIDASKVLGIRTPVLRRLARELYGTPQAESFICNLPHDYFDENNLHGLLIERIPDYDDATTALNDFLPYVDNWATCDMISPRAYKKCPPKLYAQILEWLESPHTYTIRFGIKLLMSLYLDDGFAPEIPEEIVKINSKEYYVRMMIAWYFATALAKRHDYIIGYFEERRLDPWVHNKAIQKAIESLRINSFDKAYLRSLKIK